MARKTVLRNLLNHWGILSIQMQNGMSADLAATEDSAAEAPLLITDDGEIIDLEALQETAEPEAGESNG